MTDHNRLKTGIEGLDDVLEGGLPSGHLYLIEGDPGTGKTTLALQFLLSGIASGESALYVTLSESAKELRDVAVSHGWSLDKVQIFEILPDEEALRPERQYTVFHPSEVELGDTTKAIVAKVEEVNPKRVVIDSLSELRMLAQDPLRYRRQILAFKQYFSGKQRTVLLLDDRTNTDRDLQLQSIAHGVIALENLPRDYGVKRRRIEVLKLRGSSFREGYHDYGIRKGGLSVYPRLVASEHKDRFTREQISSGIREMDSLVGGGIDRGTSTLIMGPAGAGKSTIAARYAFAAMQRGESAAIYLFDEGIPSYLARLKSLGFDTEPFVDNGQLLLRQVDVAELSPGEFSNMVRQAVDAEGAKVVIIDSLNGFMNAMPGEKYLPMQLHELTTYLNQKGIASFMVLAQHGLIGREMQTPVDVSYLADSVLLIRFFEAKGEVRQAISMIKKRSGHHERSIRELRLDRGIVVGDPLFNFKGVLTGIPDILIHKRRRIDGKDKTDKTNDLDPVQ
jgi:circadian clock protein KaiC